MAIVKAILRQPIKNVGKVGDIVSIRRGFFRYLEGLGKVYYASQEAIRRLESEREELYRQNEERKAYAETVAERLVNFTLEMTREASENGVLYGSISARDIAKELALHQVEVHPNQVLLQAPIKEAGTHPLMLELHPQVSIEISLLIHPHAKA